MENLGVINNRQILYVHVRTDAQWFEQLPASNWLAFTIANTEDKEVLRSVVEPCLDKKVSYICSTGELASLTDDYFDEEIVSREVSREEETGQEPDYDATPMTAFNPNFDEEFWFATESAYATVNDEYITINAVVCIDMTSRGVKQYLSDLTEKINSGWLPSDEEVLQPAYDRE